MRRDANLDATVNLAALRRWWRGQTAPLVLLAAVKLVVHLATNGVYGFHRDELYYVHSGLHPALGYVDYPPVTPMLAQLDTTLFGTSPWSLRIFTAVVGALLVILTGLCAREMGAGRGVQGLAGFVALVCPLRSDSPRLGLLLGIGIGVGFETKFTILALCAGIGVAMLTSIGLRARLRTRWPWIALAVATLLALPNVAWQVANGFRR